VHIQAAHAPPGKCAGVQARTQGLRMNSPILKLWLLLLPQPLHLLALKAHGIVCQAGPVCALLVRLLIAQ
jgi:hypothetical protein